MTILYFIFALIALGILVFIHELGHYLVALKMGMKVEIFSIGFGKPLLKWKWKGVDWQLATLPFGGYVKIAGMEFGKKEENGSQDPYQVENGFFKQSPLKRIAVAAAGPAANFLLAIILLTVLYAMGGREKPFSEFTQIIGWVDPASELYCLGVRPGDLLTEYNGKPYTNAKDLLYTAIQGKQRVSVKGFHVNYATGDKTPFEYIVQSYPAKGAIDDLYTTGIFSQGKYLIYEGNPDGSSSMPEGSPMAKSGIQDGDRVIWADGQLLFSMDQLSHILNDNRSLLTVKRGNTTFQTRQKRFLSCDLSLNTHFKNELIDWQYETGLKGRVQDLYLLPYSLSPEGMVQGKLSFIEEESNKEAFPEHPFSDTLERPLELGDQIVAVNGTPVSSAHQILSALQNRAVNIIVEKGVKSSAIETWKTEDKTFTHSIDENAIQALSKSVGEKNAPTTLGKYALLSPVEPKQVSQFHLSAETREANKKAYEEQLKKIEEIRSPEKKAKLLAEVEQMQSKNILGIYLQDKNVQYNPNPLVLFGNVFRETWWTLKALIFGYLNPKWLAGPIGIVQVIQHGWRVGFGEALFWISAISVNLGFLNLLPIPILDGGYICLSLWEMLTGRKLKPKTMERLIIPFVVLLFGLLIFLTFQDISRFF